MTRTPRRSVQTKDRVKALRHGDNMAEAVLWLEIQDRKLGGHKFVRQFPIGSYYADFLCRSRKLVVEIDGSQHSESEPDRRRDAYMAACGYDIIRFWNTDVLKSLNEVCATIIAALDGRFDADVEAPDLRFTRRKAPT